MKSLSFALGSSVALSAAGAQSKGSSFRPSASSVP
jgi:hypothetical protein